MLSLIAATMIAATPQVAVVTKTIPRGGAVSLENVELTSRKRLKLKRSFRAYVWHHGESLRARRTLRVGSAIGRFDVEPMPDVTAGEQVVVELSRGKMRVTATAIAVEDGLAGETIWVHNPKSRRRLRVTVIEPGRVALRAPWTRSKRR